MSLKDESGSIASKIFSQNDPKNFQTNLAPLFRKLGSSEIHKKNPAFYNLAAFTHIWLPQGNVFSRILQNTCAKVPEKFEVLIYHTKATRDLLVIWADYNSGGRIIVHLPYMAEVVTIIL